MRRLGIDIDGCLADFNRAYQAILPKVTGRDLFPPDAYKDPPCWSWEEHFGYTDEETRRVWDTILASSTFWFGLDPLPRALEALNRLNDLADDGADVYFLTHRMGAHAKQQTEAWLHQYGMDMPTVILVEDKAAVINALSLDFFVDDKAATITKVLDCCNIDPYMIKYSYNAEHHDTPRVKLVSSVAQALEDYEADSDPTA
jgi:hypothetical protein